ncbi:MAG TPA: ribonuclease domain-containing protein [Gallionella sp.]|nr:ribonuclease domain-containing protein [Gallionella sp.]
MVRRLHAALLLSLAMLLPAGAQAYQWGNGGQDLPVIAAAELPTEGRDTLRAIKQGGPFAYPRDGVVFKNYEKVLPKQSRGYYHEYTVKTPGARNRGARRIVCGQPAECYYSADHYKTFKRIRE